MRLWVVEPERSGSKQLVDDLARVGYTVERLRRDVSVVTDLVRGESRLSIVEPAESVGLRAQLRQIEHDLIELAIQRAGGDRREAARALGIGLSSLYRKLDEAERERRMTAEVKAVMPHPDFARQPPPTNPAPAAAGSEPPASGPA